MRRERARRMRRARNWSRQLPAIPKGYFYRRVEIAGRIIEEIIPLEMHPKLTGDVAECLEFRGVL